MPCFSPIKAWMVPPVKPGGKALIEFPTKNDSSFTRALKRITHRNPNAILIDLPCGKCIGCRLERSRQWAVRAVKESQCHLENCFITLTYDPEHLPKNGSLNPDDLTKFIKRFRQKIAPAKIKYIAVGEYGDKTSRPHYHLLIFGYNFKDLKKVSAKNAETGVLSVRRHSEDLYKLWKMGLVSCDKVTFESCAYVARYNLKKVNGKKAADYYGDRVPEFLHCSNGIGREWYNSYGYTDTRATDSILINGIESKLPRYFDKLHEEMDPVSYFEVKNKRREMLAKKSPEELAEDARNKYKVLMSRQKKRRNRL